MIKKTGARVVKDVKPKGAIKISILTNLKKLFTSQKSKHAHSTKTERQSKESSVTYYKAGIQEERAMKDRFFRLDPHSPIQDRIDFEGLAYYDPDPDYRYFLTLQPAETREELIFQTSTGDEQIYYRLGTISAAATCWSILISAITRSARTVMLILVRCHPLKTR